MIGAVGSGKVLIIHSFLTIQTPLNRFLTIFFFLMKGETQLGHVPYTYPALHGTMSLLQSSSSKNYVVIYLNLIAACNQSHLNINLFPSVLPADGDTG